MRRRLGAEGGDGGMEMMSLRLARVWVSGAGRLASVSKLLDIGGFFSSRKGDGGESEREREEDGVGIFVAPVVTKTWFPSERVGVVGSLAVWYVYLRLMRRVGILMGLC